MTSKRYRLEVTSFGSLSRIADYCLGYHNDDTVFNEYKHWNSKCIDELSVHL